MTQPHSVSRRARHGAHAQLGSCSCPHIYPPSSLTLDDASWWSITMRQLSPREPHGAATSSVRLHWSGGTQRVRCSVEERRGARLDTSRSETQSSSEAWWTMIVCDRALRRPNASQQALWSRMVLGFSRSLVAAEVWVTMGRRDNNGRVHSPISTRVPSDDHLHTNAAAQIPA